MDKFQLVISKFPSSVRINGTPYRVILNDKEPELATISGVVSLSPDHEVKFEFNFSDNCYFSYSFELVTSENCLKSGYICDISYNINNTSNLISKIRTVLRNNVWDMLLFIKNKHSIKQLSNGDLTIYCPEDELDYDQFKADVLELFKICSFDDLSLKDNMTDKYILSGEDAVCELFEDCIDDHEFAMVNNIATFHVSKRQLTNGRLTLYQNSNDK